MSTTPPLPQPPAPPNAQPAARTNSLALAFQDVITVILRMRYGTQRVADAAGFRASIRKMISAAVQEVRSLGYTDATSHMALYAIIGFLDESVLNSQDPTFSDWSRRPLQEEMFGGFFAGETFFRQVADLLNARESTEVADALELHAICLLLGFRGKYAFGDSGEIHGILSRIRDKILRIRGPLALARLADVPEIKFAPSRDRWLTALWITAAALVLLTIALFAIYSLSLGSGLGAIQAATLLFLPALKNRHLNRSAKRIRHLDRSEAERRNPCSSPRVQSTQNIRHLDRSEAERRDPCSSPRVQSTQNIRHLDRSEAQRRDLCSSPRVQSTQNLRHLDRSEAERRDPCSSPLVRSAQNIRHLDRSEAERRDPCSSPRVQSTQNIRHLDRSEAQRRDPCSSLEAPTTTLRRLA